MMRGARWRMACVAAAVVLLVWWAWRGRGDGVSGTWLGRKPGAPVPGRELPLIFIGGVPRSGTTLMRAMLDAHGEVRCGQETRVVPRILQMRQHWARSQKESVRLEQAGVSRGVLDNAIAAFCLEVIVRHGEPATRLCNKDPLVLKMGTYVLELFPNSKFVFMVRDGRATVHSIITRKVTITGFDLTSYRQCLSKWNHAVEVMHQQCKSLGPGRCYTVHYEELVLHPRETMQALLEFLDLEWDEAVMHHERYINQPNGVALSNVERSSDQVVRPVNQDALDKWVGQIPNDVRADMADLAPMLSVLGYDPWANPPRYADLQSLSVASHPAGAALAAAAAALDEAHDVPDDT